MKLKKWLYGLGGVAVVATPAIAVVGCSCSCSSKTYSSPESTYKYDSATKTGTYTISGSKYEVIKTALGAITSQATKAHVESLIFSSFESGGNGLIQLAPSSEIAVHVEVRHNAAPTTVPLMEAVDIKDNGDSITLSARFKTLDGYDVSATKALIREIAEGLYKGDEYQGAESSQGWAELTMVWSKIVEVIHIAI